MRESGVPLSVARRLGGERDRGRVSESAESAGEALRLLYSWWISVRSSVGRASKAERSTCEKEGRKRLDASSDLGGWVCWSES